MDLRDHLDKVKSDLPALGFIQVGIKRIQDGKRTIRVTIKYQLNGRVFLASGTAPTRGEAAGKAVEQIYWVSEQAGAPRQ